MLRLALFALIFSAGPLIATATELETRHIRVTGTGQASAIPDIARLSLGVVTEAAAAQDALRANSERMARLFSELEAADIASEDMSTSRLALAPLWSRPQDRNRRPEIEGYRVENMLHLTVRDLDGLGALLDRLVGAGASRIDAISFDLADRESTTDTARRAAVADARRKAMLYAEAAGTKIGPVLSIREHGAPHRPVFEARAAMADAAAEVPIARGAETVSVSLELVFALE